MNALSWTRFGAAIEWYKYLGYEFVDVPWIVPPEDVHPTLPAGKFPWMVTEGLGSHGSLVGSGEQSFVNLLRSKMLDLTRKYQTITPCFRAEEEYTRLTRRQFMKLELIAPADADVGEVANHAHKFFRRWYPGALVVTTPIGLDIMYNGVELGSYGRRDSSYVYGTGLAEPRFTLAGEK